MQFNVLLNLCPYFRTRQPTIILKKLLPLMLRHQLAERKYYKFNPYLPPFLYLRGMISDLMT